MLYLGCDLIYLRTIDIALNNIKDKFNHVWNLYNLIVIKY